MAHEIGACVRARRCELGYSIERAAKVAGVTASCWQKLERGERLPRVDTLMKVAKALAVTVDDLVASIQ